MIFRQVIHDDLGCASYFIGDEKVGVAAVVDPRFETDVYIELARYLGVRIEHVFETHNHADHLSGHGRLAAQTGATIHIHRLVEPEFEHEPFEHGDQFELGALQIKAVHTPGHRPEHTAFLLTDTRRGDDPWAILTGDSLFVGDVARPDLAVEKREGARGIFQSLQELLTLPDYIEIWPGHLGGSMCGGPGMDMKVSSTIGFERNHNQMLTIAGEEAFIDASVAKLGAQPPNFKAIVGLNHGPLLTEGLEVPRLYPDELASAQSEGALVIDARSDEQFARAHIPGSISIPGGRSGFGTKLAWVAAGIEQIVFVGNDEADGELAGSLAAAVGLADAVRAGGLLSGGWESWTQEKRPVTSFKRVAADEVDSYIDGDEPLQILDVRAVAEFQHEAIPGSVNVPWHDVTAIPDGIDPEQPILVICGSGVRAGTAASLLQRFGASDVIHVYGGGVGGYLARHPQAAASLV
jgi:hydroxyacylglutathione hydrolase